MKKYIITKAFSFLGLLVAGMSYAQSNDNYVQSITCLNDDCTKKSETITYFDGLGRAKQIINVKGTPTGKDLVTPVTYDGFGRQVKNILPVPVATQNSLIHSGITNESTANSYYGVSNAFTEKEIENSPLDRVLQQANPGEAWKMSSGKTQKFKYEANTGNEVKAFFTTTSTNTVNGVSNTVSALSVSSANSGFYPAGTLYKNTVTDEDGNAVVQYQNGRGQTVLIRRNDGSQNIDTYYVFNEYNQQAFIIPPKAVKQIEQNNNIITDNILNELCYQYRYDGLDRQVEKKLPGKDWEYSVYDKQDRLVLTQDGLLRTVNNNFNSKGWIFNKYDESGRVVYTGFYPNSDSRQTIQNQVNTITTSSLNNETRITNPIVLSGTNLYYRNLAFPSAGITLLTVNYYDSYPSEAPPIPQTILGQYVLPQTLDANNDASTNGILTASYVKNIEDNNWTKAYNYYDSMGRLISTSTINHLGGYTKTETELDFAGVPQKKNTYHLRKQGETGVTVQERFVYDSQNRLLQHFHQVDSNPEELLAENSYNDLSQLINKKVGAVSGSAPLQSIDYDYNIRGWLTDVNKNQMGVSDLSGKLFSYKIKYTNRDGIENPDPAQFSGKNVLPKYNGNIAEVDWRAVETLGVNPSATPKRYGYAYDKLDRLTAGFYQNPNNPYSKENTESLSYDPNGNIANLYRTSVMEYGGNTATVIDNLDYTYLGNQAIKIQDNSGNSTGYEGTAGNPIDFDVNGNMKNMIDKSIASIGYNYLNRPNSVNINLGQVTTDIATKYRADGIKVRKETTKSSIGIGGTTSSKETTDYLDGFQYYNITGGNDGGGGSESRMITRAFEPQAFTPIEIADPTIQPIGGEWTGSLTPTKTPDLQFFPTEEGFYDYVKNQYIYQYKDHLGNVRVSFARNSAGALTIVDSNDYYPFGMNHLKTGNAYFGQSSFKNYKFGKKELQEFGAYDFEARLYWQEVERFGQIDAEAEEMPYISPYAFGLNNPIKFTDPDGNAPEETVENCCQHLKGFALTVTDNILGTNLRNKYAVNSKEYRDGVNNGHGATIALSAIMAVDGGASIGGGTAGLAVSGAASSTGVGSIPGAAGATISGGAILKGTIEVAGAGVILKNTIDHMKSDKNNSSASSNKGRSGKQARLRELSTDPKLGKADKGWLKSDINKVTKGKRTTIRNPPGKDLAHERGREAAKGYSYEYSNLQDRVLHRRQHKYDNGGRKNKERPVKKD
ncbi:RHS repeat-associated core domain-containing protein [Chryseobacterium wanjuense]|uniref:RHS repeat-associated core domain-containing protein n=1 Tax=Chryseobacterium wanjuense TaxID=356305 RepID=A0A1I0QE28_9FLAO|nr:DUF6443 domain-containing protein [Chryseobacterium wanjuense]SEW25316.1 RHS repeat-associated core domain-containing protein [Chryseobacterium wanjuense]